MGKTVDKPAVRRSLKEVTDLKVMSFLEAVKSLGWDYEDDGKCFQVKCNCGNSQITCDGFIGTEVVECENCGKSVVDLFSPLRTGNSTCTVLKPSEFEIEKDEEGNDRYWVATERN